MKNNPNPKAAATVDEESQTSPTPLSLPKWIRLDDDKLREKDAKDVVVGMAGNGLRFFLGYPHVNNQHGIVKAYEDQVWGLVDDTNADVLLSSTWYFDPAFVELKGHGERSVFEG